MVQNTERQLKMKDDIMFKAFFSRKENEEFLKDMLEAILGKRIKKKKLYMMQD